MNEFLEQFLIECRELVQAATGDLLALEASPQDKALIDGVFRAFHTLKGAAGIVEFPAMGHVLHAVEDVLAAVRSGRRAVSAELIGDCLACLDQVVRWLDETETGGEVPVVPAAIADRLTARFARSETPVAKQGPPAWLEPLLSRHPTRRGLACAAFRYRPDGDCFFRGEDPLDLVSRLTGILALEITPDQPWPALDELDPFACQVIITGLVEGAPEDVASFPWPDAGQVEIWPLSGSPVSEQPAGDFSAEALAVLREQMLLISNDQGAAAFAGRLGSAALVVRNVLSRIGRTAEWTALERAFEQSQRDGTGGAFIAAINGLLAGPEEDPTRATREAPEETSVESGTRANAVQSLRVDVDRIDALVALAGELTVAKNAVGHAARVAQDGGEREGLAAMLKDQHALLDRLVSELRRSVLGIRVLPLRHVFQRFPRLVREMARDLGKPVRLTTDGETTEADKATVEALFEPLLHVIRNALDHGLEPEAERRAAGKPPAATVELRAARVGDLVIVEVTDDGRGIDTARIRRVAAQKGIASEDALAAMTDDAAIALIFAPGFSTSAAVTGVSGRGVGMDVVRAAIARIGGQVAVVSQKGIGTTVRFTLPFTVMMEQVMTVEAGGQRFGLPIATVTETVRVPRDRVSRVGAAEAVVLRGRTVPLIRLSETLNLPGNLPGNVPGARAEADDLRIVVLTVDGEIGALVVDQFGERMDVMLKPMEGLLAGMDGFAGTTLLGDGRVLIVLDPRDLSRGSRSTSRPPSDHPGERHGKHRP